MMVMLKECALDVVMKATMPIDAQQNVRGLGPVTLDYIVSSAEKTDILPVGVKKRTMIDPSLCAEVQRNELANIQDLKGDTRFSSQRKAV